MSTDADPPAREDEAALAERLRAEMLAAQAHAEVSPAIAEYVGATLAYGVASVQAEFRPLARRNWTLIRKYGRRSTALLAAMTAALIFLGVRAEVASNRAAHAGVQARQAARTARTFSAEAKHLSVENAKRLSEAQAIRHNAVISACNEANAHHRIAAGFVARLVAESPPPTSAAEARRRTRIVPLFVEALAPRCTQRQLDERLNRSTPAKRRHKPA